MGASSRCKLFMRNFSFEGTDAQRTISRRRLGKRRSNYSRLILAQGFQKCYGRSKKEATRDGAAEIEQPIVVAGRPAHKHVFEHLFDSVGRTAVADEIGAKFTVRGPAEGHVVAQDLNLFPVLDNRCECVVR